MAVCTAVAGVSLGAGGAQATVVPVDFDVPIVLRDGRLELDLNGDSVIDFIVDAHSYQSGVSFDFAAINYETDNAFSYHDVNVLPAGSAIGPVTGGWAQQIVLFETDSNMGPLFNTRGWLGLLFDIPGGSLHYGYLDLEGSVDPDDSAVATLTIHGGAYETEAERIIAATDVPEPGPLGLLALGCVGIGAMRAARAGTGGAAT